MRRSFLGTIPRSGIIRLGSPALTCAALCMSTAACGSGSATASHQPSSAPPAVGAASTPTSTASPASGSLGATSPTTPPAACPGIGLTVTRGSWIGTLGHGGFELRFHNHSRATCTMTGYPGVAALTVAGQQAVQAHRTLRGYQGGLPSGMTVPPTVTLAPGQTSYARVEWIENPVNSETSCPSYPAILVTPPNTTVSTRLKVSGASGNGIYLCASLEVHPVTAKEIPAS